MFKLRHLHERRTSGQLRRREARIARRSTTERSSAAPAPIVVTLPEPPWTPGYIQGKVEKLGRAMARFYGWREIRKRTEQLREHLIAVAKAAHIQRCQYQRAADVGFGPCGGRIRERRRLVRDVRHVERFCDTCGRVAA